MEYRGATEPGIMVTVRLLRFLSRNRRRLTRFDADLRTSAQCGSEDEATDMREVCHAAGLHLRHSTCVEELTDKPKTD